MYFLKPYFQKLIRGIGGSWMTPNQASFFGAICFLCIAIIFYIALVLKTNTFLLIFVPFLIFFRIAFNALDGLLAREQDKASVSGEILNEFLDVIGDIVCYSFLFFLPDVNFLIVILFINLIWLCEFTSVLSKSIPGSYRRQDSILGGKTERMVFLGALSLGFYFNIVHLEYVTHIVGVICFFILMTIILRVRNTLRDADHSAYVSFTKFGK